jgi:hypothetical protein
VGEIVLEEIATIDLNKSFEELEVGDESEC